MFAVEKSSEVSMYQSSFAYKSSQISDTDYPYTFGRVRLGTSKVSAIELRPNLIVVFGNLFPKLHGSPCCDISFSKNQELLQKSKYFKVFRGADGIPLILQVAMRDYTEEQFVKAFEILRDVMARHSNQLAEVKTLAFTSSVLYSAIGQKLVATFTLGVCEFLEMYRSPAGVVCVTIAAGGETLQTVLDCLDSRQQNARKLRIKGEAQATADPLRHQCGVCYNEQCHRHSLACCRGNLCKGCAKKTSICPFCRSPFTKKSRRMCRDQVISLMELAIIQR